MFELYSSGEMDRLLFEVDKFDFAKDYPWALMYKELDERFPDSKFILTTRKSGDIWYDSLRRHAKLKGKDMSLSVRGLVGEGSGKKDYIEMYENHNQEVRDYFRGRDNFAEMCWENGHGWGEICTYLGLAIPLEDFPHSNPSPNLAKRYYLKARRPIRALIKKYTGL
ncbi:hypothetical protein BSZ36_10795 [Rubricoccus marinus]|uniref:Sulfotransferase family protein n=2 Tax=Rubricoccus marinus TaxID=716817 RepID=A0A259U0S2_9BACT|nr:hypothetical protein BSZ36_10795 [Rubricoccus marinus]